MHVWQVSAPKGGAAAGDEPNDAAAAVGAARGRVVSSMMRKHLVAAVVPVALQLKRQLEEARHVLLGDLMVALASLLADHKHEVRRVSGACLAEVKLWGAISHLHCYRVV